MKQILVLGAGKSSPFLIRYLLERAGAEDWFVTVGDVDVETAKARVGGHPNGTAVAFDVNDAGLRDTLIGKANIVVNMLAPSFQPLVAWDCVNHGSHMISASYRDTEMKDLDRDAIRKDVLLLSEMGLDPGIDHMSAMLLIDRLRDDGGVIRAFRSYGAGLPAPDEPSNPLRYVITWNPRNVVMAAEKGAQYLERGKIKLVPHHKVFHHTWDVEVEGVGALEAYPNRDSLGYMETFGVTDVHTMIRGTLRYPGWSETWAQIVALGLPNESLHVPGLQQKSYRDIVEMFLPLVDGPSVEQRVARYLQISPTGRIMENLRWLGLFSSNKVTSGGDTAASVLVGLLSEKLALPAGGRDMVLLRHELDVEYPDRGGAMERVTSTMIEYGEPGGMTAMAKTVGLPLALAVELVLKGELPITGSHLPTHPSIVHRVSSALEGHGIRFVERRSPLSEGTA